MSDILILQKMLRACVRFVFDRGKFDRVGHLVRDLLGFELCDFFCLRRCILIFEILRSPHAPLFLKSLLEHGRSTRTSILVLPAASSTWSHKSPPSVVNLCSSIKVIGRIDTLDIMPGSSPGKAHSGCTWVAGWRV